MNNILLIIFIGISCIAHAETPPSAIPKLDLQQEIKHQEQRLHDALDDGYFFTMETNPKRPWCTSPEKYKRKSLALFASSARKVTDREQLEKLRETTDALLNRQWGRIAKKPFDLLFGLNQDRMRRYNIFCKRWGAQTLSADQIVCYAKEFPTREQAEAVISAYKKKKFGQRPIESKFKDLIKNNQVGQEEKKVVRASSLLLVYEERAYNRRSKLFEALSWQ